MPLKNVIAFSRSETHHSSFKKAYAEVIADLIFYKQTTDNNAWYISGILQQE